jgi:hypothetical protein
MDINKIPTVRDKRKIMARAIQGEYYLNYSAEVRII